MEFKPINTQEDFDAAIKDRLQRERETVEKKYADYDDLKKKASAYDTDTQALKQTIETANATIGELNGKIKGYETDSAKTRIALEMGLPFELRSRLNGETEEEIRADAEGLVKLIGKQNQPAPPLKNPEPKTDEKSAVLKGLRDQLLKGE